MLAPMRVFRKELSAVLPSDKNVKNDKSPSPTSINPSLSRISVNRNL